MRSEFFYLAAAAFFLTDSLHAQSEETVSMMIDVVAWGDDIGGLSFKSGEKKGGDIIARAFRYSEPIRYNGPRVLEIHKSGDGGLAPPPRMSEEDKEHELIPLPAVEIEKAGGATALPVPERLAQLRKENPTLVSLVRLPPTARRVTILLAPAAEGTFYGYVIEDDPAKLPLGKLRVHNLSPHTIAMQFGNGKQKEMASRETMLVDAPERATPCTSSHTRKVRSGRFRKATSSLSRKTSSPSSSSCAARTSFSFPPTEPRAAFSNSSTCGANLLPTLPRLLRYIDDACRSTRQSMPPRSFFPSPSIRPSHP